MATSADERYKPRKEAGLLFDVITDITEEIMSGYVPQIKDDD